jgi:hypothetical protein
MTPSDPTILPPYAPSPPAPSYSPEPADDETTVEKTHARSHTPPGNYIKECGRQTLILTGQDAAAAFPTYNRNCPVNGIVTLEDREIVSKVVLKVSTLRIMFLPGYRAHRQRYQIQAKIHVWVSGRGSMDMDLADENHPLWSSKTSNTSACPSALPFSVRLPTKFKNEDNSFALPPSYELPVNSVSGFVIKCSYSISLVVTRIPNRRLRFFTAHSKYGAFDHFCIVSPFSVAEFAFHSYTPYVRAPGGLCRPH